MVSGMDLAVLGCKRTARRDRDGAKLDRLLITAVSGPIGEIAKCTKACDAWSGRVGSEPLERAVRWLQLAFRNEDMCRRGAHCDFQKKYKVNGKEFSLVHIRYSHRLATAIADIHPRSSPPYGVDRGVGVKTEP